MFPSKSFVFSVASLTDSKSATSIAKGLIFPFEESSSEVLALPDRSLLQQGLPGDALEGGSC